MSGWAHYTSGNVLLSDEAVLALNKPAGIAVMGERHETDLVPGAHVEGDVRYRGASLYGKGVSPIAVRRNIGMVFQKPNPFPKSIYDNIAYGPASTASAARAGSTRSSSARCARPRCGTRSRTGWASRP